MADLTPRPSSPSHIDRPRIPAEYGISNAKAYLEWSKVEGRLTEARIYWIATCSPESRPRVRPVDGIYLDGVLFVGGSPETRWIRDLVSNPRVAVHLDGLDEVVLVEGDAEVIRSADDRLAERLAAASNAKFPQYRMTSSFYKENGAIAIRLRQVIAWTDITSDPTRFRFDP